MVRHRRGQRRSWPRRKTRGQPGSTLQDSYVQLTSDLYAADRCKHCGHLRRFCPPGSMQLLSKRQSLSPTSLPIRCRLKASDRIAALPMAGLKVELSRVRGAYTISNSAASFSHTFLTERDSVRYRRILPSTQFASARTVLQPQPRAHRAPPIARASCQPNPNYVPLLGCYDLTLDGQTSRIRRLSRFHWRDLQLSRPHGYQDNRTLSSGQHHHQKLHFESGDPGMTSTNGITSTVQPEPRIGARLQLQADEHGDPEPPTRAPSKRRLTKTLYSPARAATTP